MHDCANVRTSEAAAVYKLVEKEQVDLFLNLHSCQSGPFLIVPSSFNYQMHVERGKKLQLMLANNFYERKQINFKPKGGSSSDQTINMNTKVTMLSGALSLTFESSVDAEKGFDQLLEIHYTLFKTVLADGLQSPFAPRNEVIKLKALKKDTESCEKKEIQYT
jgi:hypothetical protein